MQLKIREWLLPLSSLAVALTALFYNTSRNENSRVGWALLPNLHHNGIFT